MRYTLAYNSDQVIVAWRALRLQLRAAGHDAALRNKLCCHPRRSRIRG
jgi:hypothetical protein